MMSEVITLRPPYENMLKDEKGEVLATWDVIMEMTKTSGLRPTLPDDLDPEIDRVIRDGWVSDPELRPSFATMLFRIDAISHGNRRISLFETKASAAKRTISTSGKRKSKAVLALCRNVHSLLVTYRPSEWSLEVASTVIRHDCVASAWDYTLDQVFKNKRGPAAVRYLGKLIFGGVEDGTRVHPDPILDEDVTYVAGDDFALIQLACTLEAEVKKSEYVFVAIDRRTQQGCATHTA